VCNEAEAWRILRLRLEAAEARADAAEGALKEARFSCLRSQLSDFTQKLQESARRGGPRDFWMEEQVERIGKELAALLAPAAEEGGGDGK
jgi:hypothetical protein